MFGLGFTEILLIMVVALVVFGPQRLPEIAKTLGKTMGELRRAMEEIRYDINSVSYDPKSDYDASGNKTVIDPQRPGEPPAPPASENPAQPAPAPLPPAIQNPDLRGTCEENNLTQPQAGNADIPVGHSTDQAGVDQVGPDQKRPDQKRPEEQQE